MNQKTKQIIKHYWPTIFFGVIYIITILLTIIKSVSNPFGEYFLWEKTFESITIVLFIFFVNIIILTIIKMVKKDLLLSNKNKADNIRLKRILKFCWPTIIFGISAMASAVAYPIMNMLDSSIDFAESSLGQNLNLTLKPLGLIGYPSIMIAFGLNTILNPILDNLGLISRCIGSFFCIPVPTNFGMLILLTIALIIVFLLNLLIIKIIKSIKKKKSQLPEIEK